MTRFIYGLFFLLVSIVVFTPIDWTQGIGAGLMWTALLMIPVVTAAFFIDLARLCDRLLGH